MRGGFFSTKFIRRLMPSASTSKRRISDNSTQIPNYGSKRRQSSAGSASKKGLVYEARRIYRSYLDRCRRPCRRTTARRGDLRRTAPVAQNHADVEWSSGRSDFEFSQSFPRLSNDSDIHS